MDYDDSGDQYEEHYSYGYEGSAAAAAPYGAHVVRGGYFGGGYGRVGRGGGGGGMHHGQQQALPAPILAAMTMPVATQALALYPAGRGGGAGGGGAMRGRGGGRGGRGGAGAGYYQY